MLHQFGSEILEIKNHTDNLRSFKLSIPPEIDWQFLPGQYIDLAILNQPERFSGFSLTSSCFNTKLLSISVKNEDDTGVAGELFNLKIHDKVLIKGPAGDFTVDYNKIFAVVLIGGGIGVTPLLSMFRTAVEHPKEPWVFFFHSARSKEELLFSDELNELATKRSNLNYLTAVTRDPTWKGRKTRFTPNDILEYVHHRRVDFFEFFICGPGQMNNEFEMELKKWHIQGEQDKHIHLESYYEP